MIEFAAEISQLVFWFACVAATQILISQICSEIFLIYKYSWDELVCGKRRKTVPHLGQCSVKLNRMHEHPMRCSLIKLDKNF
jgi:hypothetical protein